MLPGARSREGGSTTDPSLSTPGRAPHAREERVPAPPSRRGALSVVAFALAAAAAFATPLAAVLRPPEAARVQPSWTIWRDGVAEHPAAEAERTFAPFRETWPPPARLGYVTLLSEAELARRDDEARRLFGAQYALAPAVLRPVYLPACVATGARGCGLADLDALLVRGAPPDALVRLAEEAGFTARSRANDVTVFARRSP